MKDITKPYEYDGKDDNGNTPIYYSVSKGYFEVTELMLREGANANSSNECGNTPLHKAFMRGDMKVSLIL
jgi:ankyrin repeat protein